LWQAAASQHWTTLAQLLNWAEHRILSSYGHIRQSKANLLTQTNNIKLNYKFPSKEYCTSALNGAILSRFSSFKLVFKIIEYCICLWVLQDHLLVYKLKGNRPF
jgi:hypothetical protein